MDYTLKEPMTIAAAREIKDGDIVFCGTGISMLAAMAAKKISAPNSVIFFETGAIDSPCRVGFLRDVPDIGKRQSGRCVRNHAEPDYRAACCRHHGL